MMEEVSDHVGMNYPDNFDSRYVAQPVNDFLFPWGEGSLENAHTIDEERGSLSQKLQPANTKTTTGDGGKTSFALH